MWAMVDMASYPWDCSHPHRREPAGLVQEPPLSSHHWLLKRSLPQLSLIGGLKVICTLALRDARNELPTSTLGSLGLLRGKT